MTTRSWPTLHPEHLATSVAARVEKGARFCGLFARAGDDGSTTLQVVLADQESLEGLEALLAPGESSYPALTPAVPPAAWYERQLHDLFGVEPTGHPRLDPLVLPLADGSARPRPGRRSPPATFELDDSPLPGHVTGEGVFTIPYGPVRSGVFESVEYLVETSGEDIPHLRTRVYHKHRGLSRRFCDLPVADGVLLAERVEGTASVAHAWSFCQGLEALAGVEVPPPAGLVRVVHAELERVAAHLDSAVRHTEGSGQAIAHARLALHKERVMRLRAELCGHRFGRGVVVPGGVAGAPAMAPEEVLTHVDRLERAIADDLAALMRTPSFLDRLSGTGRLSSEVTATHGAVGPLARASGLMNDVRVERPYGAYRSLGFEPAAGFRRGDALGRQEVRAHEITQAFHLIRQCLDELSETSDGPWRAEVPRRDGTAICSVEAPQGELVYLVEIQGGALIEVATRTASFHNLSLFDQAFPADILTDFVFIEASFGLSIAGVSG